MAMRSILSAGASVLAALAVGCAAADDDPATVEGAVTQRDADNPNPALFPKDSSPFGVSMAGWAERWWAWVEGTPFAVNPNIDPTADCRVNQRGPMYFLAHPLVGPSTTGRTCIVPPGKPIAISVATALNDFPCPDPTFVPAPGQSLFDFLIAGAKEVQDHVAAIEATLDGQPLVDVLSYRVASDDVFQFTGDISMQQFDNCITGTRQEGVVDTFLLVLRPLQRGTHTFTARTTSIFGTVFGPRTITLQVDDGDDDP
jgi:hypothetical protein